MPSPSALFSQRSLILALLLLLVGYLLFRRARRTARG